MMRAIIILSAVAAIAGCNPPPQPITECVNSQTGERAVVVEWGWGKKVRDAKGYEFWIENKDTPWRCKELPR